MDIIHENPFRILGLNANSTERELQKQIAKVKRFLDVGKTVHFPTDYPFLRSIERPLESIHLASGQIEQSYKKFYYALFWFVSETTFDEIAFKKLEVSEVSEAIDVWSKKLKGEVNDQNFSAYLNLSSLYSALSFEGNKINHKILSKGLYLKGNLLKSHSLSKLAQLLHIKLDSIDTEQLTVQFVEETLRWLTPFIDKPNGIKAADVLGLFSEFPSSIQKYLADKFTEEPVREIKNKIEKCRQWRKLSPLDANNLAKDLYRKSKGWLDSLRTILGSENVKYQLIASNLASEILQCSIDYFNAQKEDGNNDPHRDALLVLSFSEKIDAHGQIAQRLIENREILEELMEVREEEKTIEGVQTNISNITREIENFKNASDKISTANALINSCQKDLETIAKQLGDDDETFLVLSDAVVNSSLQMLIAVVNLRQENPKYYGLEHTLRTLTEAKVLAQKLLNTRCSYRVKARVKENLQTISDLKFSLDNMSSQLINQIISKKSSGCYVATMAYGSYDHPQVKILRQYRDDVLDQSWYGRLFIKIYYITSPYLVALLQGHKKSNSFIRKSLDKFIGKLQK